MEGERGIVDALYAPAQAGAIRTLWQDVENRQPLRAAIGEEFLRREDLILNFPSVDMLMLVCATSQFADDEMECSNVALFVHRGIRIAGLPELLEEPLTFSIKALTALAFFVEAIERRTRRRGAPAPNFYRKVSQARFELCGFESIARHHTQWEGFLAEKLGG